MPKPNEQIQKNLESIFQNNFIKTCTSKYAKLNNFLLLLDLNITILTVDLVDCRCRFLKKVNNHLQIQTKSLQILKVSKKKFCSLTQVCSQSSPHIRFRSALLHQLNSPFQQMSTSLHSGAPHSRRSTSSPTLATKNVTAQLDETQHRTGSLYGGSLQGVNWPTRLFRQRPVLGLRHRARGTST